MKAVEIVDPVASQEAAVDAYRVRFWERPTPHEAENLSEFRLSDVDDVREALAWIEARAAGRRVELFVERQETWDSAHGAEQVSVLLRLAGVPAEPSSSSSVLFSIPANARRLTEAIERSDAGIYEVHELDRD